MKGTRRSIWGRWVRQLLHVPFGICHEAARHHTCTRLMLGVVGGATDRLLRICHGWKLCIDVIFVRLSQCRKVYKRSVRVIDEHRIRICFYINIASEWSRTSNHYSLFVRVHQCITCTRIGGHVTTRAQAARTWPVIGKGGRRRSRNKKQSWKILRSSWPPR